MHKLILKASQFSPLFLARKCHQQSGHTWTGIVDRICCLRPVISINTVVSCPFVRIVIKSCQRFLNLFDSRSFPEDNGLGASLVLPYKRSASVGSSFLDCYSRSFSCLYRMTNCALKNPQFSQLFIEFFM